MRAGRSAGRAAPSGRHVSGGIVSVSPFCCPVRRGGGACRPDAMLRVEGRSMLSVMRRTAFRQGRTYGGGGRPAATGNPVPADSRRVQGSAPFFPSRSRRLSASGAGECPPRGETASAVAVAAYNGASCFSVERLRRLSCRFGSAFCSCRRGPAFFWGLS